MALEEQRKLGRLERMDRVAAFVQERAYVVVYSDGIHEDQRHLSERERLAVTAGSLALAIVEVEQPRVRHAAVVGLKVRIDVSEHVPCLFDEGSDAAERLERLLAIGIGTDVPWPKGLEVHVAAPPL